MCVFTNILCFFFNDTATTEIYTYWHTLSLHDALPICGILIDWSDFDQLSAVVPLLARIYPNGGADVNHFHAAGGMGLLIRELLEAGLLHEDVRTVAGDGLRLYRSEEHTSELQSLMRISYALF